MKRVLLDFIICGIFITYLIMSRKHHSDELSSCYKRLNELNNPIEQARIEFERKKEYHRLEEPKRRAVCEELIRDENFSRIREFEFRDGECMTRPKCIPGNACSQERQWDVWSLWPYGLSEQ